jgi:hypothetical protein
MLVQRDSSVGAKLNCQSPALRDRGTEAADLMGMVLMSKRELKLLFTATADVEPASLSIGLSGDIPLTPILLPDGIWCGPEALIAHALR